MAGSVKRSGLRPCTSRTVAGGLLRGARRGGRPSGTPCQRDRSRRGPASACRSSTDHRRLEQEGETRAGCVAKWRCLLCNAGGGIDLGRGADRRDGEAHGNIPRVRAVGRYSSVPRSRLTTETLLCVLLGIALCGSPRASLLRERVPTPTSCLLLSPSTLYPSRFALDLGFSE